MCIRLTLKAEGCVTPIALNIKKFVFGRAFDYLFAVFAGTIPKKFFL
jgi:hypothetical protein